MTTPATRGEALALAVERIASQAIRTPTDRIRDDLRAALATYRASQAEGERVRLAAWYREDRYGLIEVHAGYDPSEDLWADCPKPDFYIVATIPPRTTPPSVDAEVCE